MPNATNTPASAPVITPTQTPTVAPDAVPWPQRFTDPIQICPQQKRELTSPDVAP